MTTAGQQQAGTRQTGGDAAGVVRCPQCSRFLAELDADCRGQVRLRCGSCKRRWLLNSETREIRRADAD